MNYSADGEWIHAADDVTNTNEHSRRELLLKTWFGISVLLSCIGLGMTLWGTVYHPAGSGGSTGNIDFRTVIAGLLCLSCGATALSIFCWYTKCCNSNGLPDCPANGRTEGIFDDDDVPKHIPPPLPGLLIAQTIGPVQPGTIANLTPPQIHKLASTPTGEVPSAMSNTPRVSFSGQLPRSARGSFSDYLPQSSRRSLTNVHSLPGLSAFGGGLGAHGIGHSSSRLGCGGHSPPKLSACAQLRSPVRPGTIDNLTPPQIHKLARTPTDEHYNREMLLYHMPSMPRDKFYLSPNYAIEVGGSSGGSSSSSPSRNKSKTSNVPIASVEDNFSSRRSSYASVRVEQT
ncbi:Uncharacterised protein g8189 [Pycnogonum litorale]